MVINLDINLDKHISKTFRRAAYDILNFRVSEVIFKGGRSSFKSAVATIAVIMGVLINKVSALVIVKTDTSSYDKLANNLKKYMRILGVEHRFLYVKTNQRFVLLDKKGRKTSHVIRIKGANNVDELKSMTTDEPEGYGYTFIEEATLFKTDDDIESLFSTAMRGTGKHCFIIAYNPPMETDNHLNKRYGNAPCGKDLGFNSAYYYTSKDMEVEGIKFTRKTLIHHSTYLDAIRDGCYSWIGLDVIGRYEEQKENNFRAWQWDKLGMIIGTDANIFWNIHNWNYTEDIHFKSINRGLDISNGGPDPWMYNEWYYDRVHNDLYCLNECRLAGNSDLSDVKDNIRKINKMNYQFYIDSAVPLTAKQLRTLGLNPIPAKKGQDSVKAGLHWLMSLNHIYIDPVRCPVTYSEFKNHKWIIDKYGEITSKPEDKNNHSIDSCRYAMSFEIKYA